MTTWTTKDISDRVLRKMPRGKYIGPGRVQDMSGNWRNALLWSYRDEYGPRMSWFDVDTAEYLGEDC